MDFDDLKTAARDRLDPLAWDYVQGVADGRPGTEPDQDAWRRIDLVPRILQGLTSVNTTPNLGLGLSTPVMVAATASHGLAHPAAEVATATAAAEVGALMVYSSTASIEVGEFGAAAAGPWWAQVYVMRDRRLTDDYLQRIAAARPAAIVLTADNMGAMAEAPFRKPVRPLPAQPANYPGLTWRQMSQLIEPGLVPGDIGRIAAATGLPVHVKGVLHPADAIIAIEAGAAGIVVSNHGRRQVAGVVPTAVVLAEIAAAVDGRVPVMVDGGIRSGVDVFRAIGLGATAVGIGRPVLWGLAAAGTAGVVNVLATLDAELRQVMAACGAATVAAISPTMLRPPSS